MADVQNTDLPRSREAALRLGSQFYFTGRPCPRGHIARRYTSAMTCTSCSAEHGRQVTASRVKTRPVKPSGPCSVGECGRPVFGVHGLCSMHYQRMRLHGAPGAPSPRKAARGAPSLLHCGGYRGQCPGAKKLSTDLHRLRNLDAYREVSRQKRLANKEQIAAKKAAEHRANPHIALQRMKEWKEANPGRYRALNARSVVRYREYLSRATPSWANWAEIDRIYATCPKGWHVDHIVPIRSRIVCGLHVPWNLRHLPADENMSKQNKLIDI